MQLGGKHLPSTYYAKSSVLALVPNKTETGLHPLYYSTMILLFTYM